jgi:uncharacterized membrane protein YfcA
MLVAATALGLVFVTSFVSGLFGVAGGLILMGGLVYALPVAQAMLVHGLAQFVSNAGRVLFWRRFVAWAHVLEFVIGALACLAAFAVVRFVPGKVLVLFLLGFSTVLMCLVPQRWAPKITRRGVPLACGVVGMALMLTAGVSGTFLDQFFVRAELDRRTTVATKAAMQAVSHSLKAGYFGFAATAGLDSDWWGILAAVPAASIAGTALASRFLDRMTDRQFYWWTRRIVLVIGLYFLADAARHAFLA